jgi:alpha-D-xyloside xylohydrolase
MMGYQLSNFLSETPVPVELAAQLEATSLEGSTARLKIGTLRFTPVMHNYYGTLSETVQTDPTPGATASLQLDFCTPEIVRLRYAPGGTVPENATPMVVGSFTDPVAVTMRKTETSVTFETAALRIVFAREPFQISIYNLDGKLLWETRPLDLAPLRRPANQWSVWQQRWIFMHRYAYPLGIADHGDTRAAFVSVDLRHDEHIYGFGESFGRLDKRETFQKLWIEEAYNNYAAPSYKRVPFYMSTRGLGVYLNTSNYVGANVGDRDHTALSLTVRDTTFFDLYLIYGPTLKDILPRYTSITGAPAVPPKWSFGLWMGRISYNQQTQVETVAAELRARHIPCDVIHIDTDWYEHDWECDLKFSPTKFPDPAGMLAKLRALGLRVSLWQWPNMVITSEMFAEGLAGGYLAKRGNGKPYINTGFENDAGFIDYSNPEAVQWVQAKFRELFALGVAAIKTDFGEGAAPDAIYHSGKGAAMHNLYPLLYNKAIFEVTEEVWGKGIVWSRSAWAGSQRYPVHWNGDGIARWQDLPAVLRSILNFGLSGFPFYSHDIGGFNGIPDPELYIRWAQLGLFTSHARAHGNPPREPWLYGEQAETIFRQYDELRYRLMPYIYSEAVLCGQTSTPLLRPLLLDYPEDQTVYGVDDEYLFGRSLLVAPILTSDKQRHAYLPPGQWVNYWSKETVEGEQWIEIDAPLDMLPLYVRGGAILPYAPLMQYVDETPLDPLTVEIYAPASFESYTIYEEDGSWVAVAYRDIGQGLAVEVCHARGEVEVVVYWGDGSTVTERVPSGGTIVFIPHASTHQ